MVKGLTPKKLAIICVWALLVVFAFYTWQQSGIAAKEVPVMLDEWLSAFGLLKASLIYIVLFALRPITLFPATPLAVASGVLFGPWIGILLSIVGENISANVAFMMSRYLGRDFVQVHESGSIKKWDQKLCTNGLVTVLIMRFLYLPFDGVNFGCGLTFMRQRDFAIGTFIGIMPGIITFVLLGGVVSVKASGMLTILGLDVSQRMFVLVLSGFFFVLGLVIAKILKNRNHNAEACPTE